VEAEVVVVVVEEEVIKLGITTLGSYINGVNQGYVLDNRNGRIT